MHTVIWFQVTNINSLSLIIASSHHHHHHHHQVAQLARISLSLSRQSSLLSIAPSKSCSLHPVSIQSYCRYVLLGRPTLARSRVKGSIGEHHWWFCSRFYSSCPTSLVCLTWMVLEIGGRWLYSCCFVGCCFQDLINTAPNFSDSLK